MKTYRIAVVDDEPSAATAGTLNSLDAFWLWLVIFPLLCYYFAGVIYGTAVSLPFVILSILFMWTPISKSHADYGSNYPNFFPDNRDHVASRLRHRAVPEFTGTA